MADEEKKLNEAIKQDGIETQSGILDELKRRYPQYVEQSHNEQEIERMQNILIDKGVFNNMVILQGCAYPDAMISECCLQTAEILNNAGIGDKKQAVKEAFEELQKFCADADIVGVNGNVIMLDEIIDGIITELYGADE